MSNSPPFFGNSASNLISESEYNKEIDRLSQKVITELPNGKSAHVYTHSNMLQLAELYNDIAKRSGLDKLKERIKKILAEHKKQCGDITPAHGCGFLKKKEWPKSRRNMRKSRKPVKGRKSCRKTRK